MGNHQHNDCRKVKNVKDRKCLFRKYVRCFICINKGHLAWDCRSGKACEQCEGKHHGSICECQGLQVGEAEGKSITVDPSAQGKVDGVVTSTGANSHVGGWG